ncbi:MAG: hypothetical protein IJW92_03575 [Clostridia bacterium]|nr:hypothetical protein [Clostridia bacterium]
MHRLKAFFAWLLICALLIFSLSSCGLGTTDVEIPVEVEITNGDRLSMKLGDTLQLNIDQPDVILDQIVWEASNGNAAVTDSGLVTALDVGKVVISATYREQTDKILIEITDNKKVELTADRYYLMVGDTATLTPSVTPVYNGTVTYRLDGDVDRIEITENRVTALQSGGEISIVAIAGGAESRPITLYTVEATAQQPTHIALSVSRDSFPVGETATLSYSITPYNAAQNIRFVATAGADCVKIVSNQIIGVAAGSATVVGIIGEVVSNEITVTVTENPDRYQNMTAEEFYANYTPATSATDAYYRSLYGFLSGSLTVPDQAPEVSELQPAVNGILIRNEQTLYSEDGNAYTVVDACGDEVFRVYRGGAYITLEEVAAYVYAFGDVPANYVTSKNADPENSIWGKYLRLNHSYFSGDTDQYPYEPVLPDIRGCGGELYYYEIDIGTTGTDCDPRYICKLYNDGDTVTRGAARIVYARYDANHDQIIDPNERYLFYTYNHYNDFQEYLNYYGGWGEMFGNITGGGSISSRTDYNPTAYVPSILGSLTESEVILAVAVWNLPHGKRYGLFSIPADTRDNLFCA